MMKSLEAEDHKEQDAVVDMEKEKRCRSCGYGAFIY